MIQLARFHRFDLASHSLFNSLSQALLFVAKSNKKRKKNERKLGEGDANECLSEWMNERKWGKEKKEEKKLIEILFLPRHCSTDELCGESEICVSLFFLTNWLLLFSIICSTFSKLSFYVQGAEEERDVNRIRKRERERGDRKEMYLLPSSFWLCLNWKWTDINLK